MQTCFFYSRCFLAQFCEFVFRVSRIVCPSGGDATNIDGYFFRSVSGTLKLLAEEPKLSITSKLKMGCQFHRGLFLRFGDNVVEMEGAGAGVGNLIYLLTGIESTSRTIREHNASNAVHILHTCI